MFVARSSALGWARDESRLTAISGALRNSSLGMASGDVEVEVWETEAEQPYVNQMGSVCVDADDPAYEEDSDADLQLEPVEGLTLPEEQAQTVTRLLSALDDLERHIEAALRFTSGSEEDPSHAIRFIQDDAKGVAAELAKLKELRG